MIYDNKIEHKKVDITLEEYSQSYAVGRHLEAITQEHNFTNPEHNSIQGYGSVDVLCSKKHKKNI